jgi:type IV secretory pathway TraG/TraD family ATPase VirD4
LDEAANYPLPSLGALMSEGGGTGISTVAVLQSLAQARHRWGREQAQGIWDSAIVKIVLGGSSNADDLNDIARLVGDRTEREFSQTAQSGGGRSISTSSRERAILDPSAIRAITPGHALLLLRSARPIMLTLRPWTARPDAHQLRRDRASIEDAVRNASGQGWPDHA